MRALFRRLTKLIPSRKKDTVYYPVSGPLSQPTFWNELFRYLQWPDVWTAGMSVTPAMAERGAHALLGAIERAARTGRTGHTGHDRKRDEG